MSKTRKSIHPCYTNFEFNAADAYKQFYFLRCLVFPSQHYPLASDIQKKIVKLRDNDLLKPTAKKAILQMKAHEQYENFLLTANDVQLDDVRKQIYSYKSLKI